MSVAWFDGVTVTVEAALTAASGSFMIFDVGRFDTGTFGPDIVWSDISQYVRRLSSSRRFSREVAAWDPGTASFVLDNRLRYFSPSFTGTSPFVVGGISQIRPLRQLRWKVTYAGTTYYIYTGYAQEWQETFLKGAHGDAYVTVPCLDEMSNLSAFDGLEETPAGAGETSGRRVHRVLDNAGYTGARNVELGMVTLQATNLSANATAELKLTADSEGGSLFIDADGSVCFEQQLALMDNTRSNTIQATFGDSGTAAELPYSQITPTFAGDMVRNIISYARVGGTAQLAADAASRQLYRDRRETRTDLVCETDGQALALAEFELEQFKDPEQRITQIQVHPRRAPTRLFPVVLGLRVRDLIRVIYRPAGGGTITRDCHVSGISHEVSKSTGSWTTTFDLASASVYQAYSDSRFDVGRFDEMAFFFGSGG